MLDLTTWGRLRRALHRVFDPDPQVEVALFVEAAGQYWSWQVTDEQFVMDATDQQGDNWHFSAALADHTLSTLSSALRTAGARVRTSGLVDLRRSAMVLMPQIGSSTLSNGDHVAAYTSLTWILLRALAQPLAEFAASIPHAINQVYLDRAQHDFLDLHGDYYGIARGIGETDAAYFARLLATILMARNNNVAIQLAIAQWLQIDAQDVQVVDADQVFYGTPTFYDGTSAYDDSLSYNGWTVANSGNTEQTRARFLVLLPAAVLANVDAAHLRQIINLFKAAGTHLLDDGLLPNDIMLYNGLYEYDGSQNFTGMIQP